MSSSHDSARHPSLMVYYAVFAALLVLLVLTVAISYVDLGPWGFVTAVAIASVKALLIVLYFMHVRYGTPLTWLVAGAGFGWLAILFAGTLADFYFRGIIP